MEQQLSDNVISNRKTHESLLSAERQLSQLDAENILLRQLRVLAPCLAGVDAPARGSGVVAGQHQETKP